MNKFIAAIALTLLVSACGGDETSPVALPDGKGGFTKMSAKGDDNHSEVTMTGADGKTVKMTSDAKQARFPAFAPQYPGSSVTAATTMNTDGKSLSTVTMSSPDKVDAVVEFYKASVTKAGMPIGMSGNFDGTGTIQAGATTDDKAPSMVVSAAPKDGVTEITLILTNAS